MKLNACMEPNKMEGPCLLVEPASTEWFRAAQGSCLRKRCCVVLVGRMRFGSSACLSSLIRVRLCERDTERQFAAHEPRTWLLGSVSCHLACEPSPAQW
jgi:hypothetical protein